MHSANTAEVDLLFWNERRPSGLYFLDAPFLVECKNWAIKVDGQAIVYFASTMAGRCCRDGILVAAKGITGEPGTLEEAHYPIAMAAREGRRILVLTRDEIENLTSGRGLVELLKVKVLEVARKGTTFV